MSGRDSIYIVEDFNFEHDKCDNYVKFIEEYNETGELSLNKSPKITDDARDEWQKRINYEVPDKIKPLADLIRLNLRLTIYGDPGYIFQKIEGDSNITIDCIRDANADVVPKDKIKCLTIIVALNEFDSNTDLYFPKQGVSIKLKKGEIVVFPPYWTHPYKIRTTDPNSVVYTMKTWMFGES